MFLGAVALNFVAADLAAPRAGGAAALFDELLEPAQIALDPSVVHPEHVADTLSYVLRLPVHLELDLRLVLVDRDEANDAFIARTRRAPPRDDLVGDLLVELGVTFFDLAAALRAPVQTLVIELLDGLDALHEARELLELSPLVVGDADRNVHVNGFLHCRHGHASSS